jgi:DNA-binding MarR family transcriptional regulator
MDDVETIALALERWLDRLGRRFGPVSRSQHRMLAAVAAGQDGVRVSDLAAQLDVTVAGATRMVDKLVALGYVQRYQRPEADQRQVQVALTPAGSEALAAADRVFAAHVASTLSCLDDTQRAQLAALLQRIAGGVDGPRSPTPDLAAGLIS